MSASASQTINATANTSTSNSVPGTISTFSTVPVPLTITQASTLQNLGVSFGPNDHVNGSKIVTAMGAERASTTTPAPDLAGRERPLKKSLSH